MQKGVEEAKRTKSNLSSLTARAARRVGDKKKCGEFKKPWRFNQEDWE